MATQRKYGRYAKPKNEEPVAIGQYKLDRELYKALTGRGAIAVKAINLRTGRVENLGYFREPVQILTHTYHTFASVKMAPSGQTYVSATRDGNFLNAEKDRFLMSPELGEQIPSLPTPSQFDNCEQGKAAGLPDMSVMATIAAWAAECATDGGDKLLADENAQLRAMLSAFMKQNSAPIAVAPETVAQAVAPAPVATETAKPAEAPAVADVKDPFQAGALSAPSDGNGAPTADDFAKFAGAI